MAHSFRERERMPGNRGLAVVATRLLGLTSERGEVSGEGDPDFSGAHCVSCFPPPHAGTPNGGSGRAHIQTQSRVLTRYRTCIRFIARALDQRSGSIRPPALDIANTPLP